MITKPRTPSTRPGVGHDRDDVGVIYGILRSKKQVVASRLSHSREYEPLKRSVQWKRNPQNPILPPGKKGAFDSTRCMNPWVLRMGDAYHLYYSGGDAKGRQRICLAPDSDVQERLAKRRLK